MSPTHAANDWPLWHARFGEELRRRINAVGEGNGAGDTGRLEERLIQAAWYDQALRGDELVTASGKRLRVLEPGRWNVGPGPDFRDARVVLAGEEHRGDVEIHLQSADWERHGHHQDFEYNATVLHVALHASDDRPYETLQNGARLERLVLLPFLEPDLETLRRTINLDDYPYGAPSDAGICHRAFVELPESQVREFLASAGRARIEEKVARLRQQAPAATPRQLFYQALMVGQGYKSSKTLYFLLSKRAPVEELFDYALDVPAGDRRDLFLAILLHVAQLYPSQPDFFEGLDAESRAFCARIESLWRNVRGYFADRLIPPTKRWHAGMRPAGFPGRRLAAVAEILARVADPTTPLLESYARAIRAIADDPMPNAAGWKRTFAEWTAWLTVEGDGNFFQTHYTIGGKPCKALALLGEPAARSSLFNVVLPLMVLRARTDGDDALESGAWAALERFPALPKNSVTDFMRRRLFAETGHDKAFFATELLQQSLFRVFSDCCATNERTCSDCTFLNPPFKPVG